MDLLRAQRTMFEESFAACRTKKPARTCLAVGGKKCASVLLAGRQGFFFFRLSPHILIVFLRILTRKPRNSRLRGLCGWRISPCVPVCTSAHCDSELFSTLLDSSEVQMVISTFKYSLRVSLSCFAFHRCSHSFPRAYRKLTHETRGHTHTRTSRSLRVSTS